MSAMDENLIREMAGEALNVSSVAAYPMTQFRRWYAQAKSARIPREDAMTLATVGPDGAPAARIVLYKDLSDLGFSEPGFPSSRTMRAIRPRSSRATREPPSSSTGSPPPGRCAPRASWKNCPQRILTPISPPARAAAR